MDSSFDPPRSRWERSPNIILTYFCSNYKLYSSFPTLNNLIMVFTVALATAFLCAPNHMGLTNNVRVAFFGEGIVSFNDLEEFHENHWQEVVTNFKCPASFPDPEKMDSSFDPPRSRWERSPLNVSKWRQKMQGIMKPQVSP